jgi:hypothetical protein
VKRVFKLIALIISVAAAFVCLTLNVGSSDVGGITGTLVVQKGASQATIQQTKTAFRVAGLGWVGISVGLLFWNLRRPRQRPINKNTPDAAIVHNNRGWNYHKRLGMLDAAIQEYETALTIEQNYPEAWNNLGLAYGEKGRTDQAISCLKKAVTLAPALASAHNDLAICYFSTGEKQLAREHALRAKELGHTVHPEFMKMLQ